MKMRFKIPVIAFVTAIAILTAGQSIVHADKAAVIDAQVKQALQELYETAPSAKALGENAKGILVFPDIVKGGFMIGGQYGTGALIKDGEVVEYYTSTALSYGLQIGAQKFGYAVFLMSDEDLEYLDRSDGWEIGGAPSLVIADSGVATALSTSTIKKGVYAFFFGQKGLMAGLGLQGTKITKYTP